MNYFLTSLLIFTFVQKAFASSNYIDTTSGSVRNVLQAIQDQYGSDAGVGDKNDSCLLCHDSASGGPGNINAGFGTDFVLASQEIGLGSGSGLSSSQLRVIFADSDFANLDSDNDGIVNADEFTQNLDPADNISESGGVSTGNLGSNSGSGCGTIAMPTDDTPTGPPFLLTLIFLLPLVLVFAANKRGQAFQDTWKKVLERQIQRKG